MIRIAIIFITAILISVVAAYFSIVGLAALFAATFWGVVIMGATLEAGKVVAATWAHEHWGDPSVSKLHKGYLVAAVCALMLVTSLGIYGYLSKGHLEQAAPMAGTNLQIQQGELRIQQIEADNARLTTRLNQLDQSVDVMLSNDRASQGLRARRQQASERTEINSTMDANNQQIQQIQTELLPLKTSNLEVEAKLGPVKYVAELFGWQDPEVAVRMIILIIMVAFDPLALVLILSGGISLRQYQERKRLEAEKSQPELTVNTIDGLHGDRYLTPEDLGIAPLKVEDFASGPVVGGGTLVTELPGEAALDDQAKEDLAHFHSRMMKPLFVPAGYPPEDKAEEPEAAFPFMKELEEHGTVHEEVAENPAAVKLEIAEQTEAPVESENEEGTPPLTEKEKLLIMLEKNPEILQDIIEVVDTYRTPTNHTVQLRGSHDPTNTNG
jgi:hypothetical protein